MDAGLEIGGAGEGGFDGSPGLSQRVDAGLEIGFARAGLGSSFLTLSRWVGCPRSDA